MTPESKDETVNQQQNQPTFVDRVIERLHEAEREKSEPKQQRRSEKQEGLER